MRRTAMAVVLSACVSALGLAQAAADAPDQPVDSYGPVALEELVVGNSASERRRTPLSYTLYGFELLTHQIRAKAWICPDTPMARTFEKEALAAAHKMLRDRFVIAESGEPSLELHISQLLGNLECGRRDELGGPCQGHYSFKASIFLMDADGNEEVSSKTYRSDPKYEENQFAGCTAPVVAMKAYFASAFRNMMSDTLAIVDTFLAKQDKAGAR